MYLAWTLFIVYLLGTSYLGYLGYKKTEGFSSFAIGKGDLSPFVVGVTLAASTASAATFIINPGFVYVDGLSAWINTGFVFPWHYACRQSTWPGTLFPRLVACSNGGGVCSIGRVEIESALKRVADEALIG